ncbi:hypothetical protein NPIL_465371, partial [Nephila pilipes]
MLASLILAFFISLVSKPDAPTIENNEIDEWQQALENSELFGGDMLIPPGTILGNAIAEKKYRWPNNTIYYSIDKSI